MITSLAPDIQKRTATILGVMLAVVAASHAADQPLVRLKDAFERRLLKMESESSPDSPLLRKQYAGSLQHLQEQARKAGKLESLVAAQEEIKRFDREQSVARSDIKDPGNAVGKLQKGRTVISNEESSPQVCRVR